MKTNAYHPLLNGRLLISETLPFPLWHPMSSSIAPDIDPASNPLYSHLIAESVAPLPRLFLLSHHLHFDSYYK